MKNNQKILQFRKANCRNCYKCVRNCPVKAVEVVDQQARIREKECVLCEKCTLVCPQNAKVEMNVLSDILRDIETGNEYAITFHPGFLTEYGSGSLLPLKRILKSLGFSYIEEMAEVVQDVGDAYGTWLREHPNQVWLSSHCPVIVQLIHKYYPSLKESLIPVASFMQAHARIVKKEHPNTRVVALMPCIASVSELEENGNAVDYVITYRELQRYLRRHEIELKPETEKETPLRSRFMIRSDGFSGMIPKVDDICKIPVDGMECVMRILNEVQNGGYSDVFLDLYACQGGCMGGPSFRNRITGQLELLRDIQCGLRSTLDFERNKETVDLSRAFAGIAPVYSEVFTEEQIQEVLLRMDKFDAEDLLNCGACGYDSCHEKAIAILQGKAEENMCVPYMRSCQETYANKIIHAVPGLLVTVDYNLKVVTMNQRAQNFFRVGGKRRIIGESVDQIMDDRIIIDMIAERKSLSQDQVRIKDNGRTLDRVFTNDRKNRLILCMMKDITRENEVEYRLRETQKAAVRMADCLVEEQLRIVHEIAGLLGETAADTKVAVERLKSTIMMEEDSYEEE